MKEIDLLRQQIQVISGRDYAPKDDDDLFEGGFLDSLDMTKIILFLEKDFRIVFERTDLRQKNFTSVRTIIDFVERKRSSLPK